MPIPVSNLNSRPVERQGMQGFTLVEMLVALIILSVSILALTSVTITAIRANTQTEIRNTAVRLTQETAEDFLARSFDSISTGSATRNVSINGVDKPFDIEWTVTETSANLKQIEITVESDFGTESLSNSTVVYKHSAN